ncbi:divalent metal cation transporter [Candidatus Uhrbacteria bacterium]|nr:divalent metal cation transporter [Candidatus Uhrbacteria bacterium]
MLGPGLTTGASDDDPAGIATYSQAGARYGNQLLWLAGFTFPLMALVQEMCARIGLVTGKGLAANIRQYFPRWVLITSTTLLFAANTFNLGADLGAMANAVQLLLPTADFTFLVICFAGMSLLLQIFSTYARYAKYLKYLTMFLFAYVFSALLIRGLDWHAVFLSAITPITTFSRDQIILICGILGTTISPYLFFWQTSQEVEEEILQGNTTLAKRQGATNEEIRHMRIDVWVGMFFSNLVMFFIIVACAGTLFPQGITTIQTAADAAKALQPFAGNASYLFFALGIIGTGLLAVPVLAGSASYAVAESFGWKQGLFYKLNQAYAFYGVLIIAMIIGLLLNFVGIDPIKALLYSAVVNGIIAPLVLVLIILISRDKKIMGAWQSGLVTQACAWIITILMGVAGLATIAALLPFS